jgi:serine/threonine-protein kinase
MEYLSGENLKSILVSKKFIDFNLKLHIIKEVAKALQDSHALKIVHRDVSPDNIIVQGKKVTLFDFGIAKKISTNHQTDPGIIMGRLSYISPEQFEGSKATSKSDIYALGAVSFYLVEGKPMYASTNPDEMNMHHNYPLPTIKAKVPEDLKRFIYRMLGKDSAYHQHG